MLLLLRLLLRAARISSLLLRKPALTSCLMCLQISRNLQDRKKPLLFLDGWAGSGKSVALYRCGSGLGKAVCLLWFIPWHCGSLLSCTVIM